MSQEMRRALEEMADWLLLGLISPEEAEEIIQSNLRLERRRSE